MDNEPFSETLGEFLYPQCYARYRLLSPPLANCTVALAVLEGISGSALEDFLVHSPKDFYELTQHVCRDLWSSLKHLSVGMEDLWIRLGRGFEMRTTSFRDAVLDDDVVLLVVLPTSDRVDEPVIHASITSSSKNPHLLKTSSNFLAKRFKRQPSQFSIQLNHLHLAKGGHLERYDAEFFVMLKYATISRDFEGVPAAGLITSVSTSLASRNPYVMTCTMDDVRNYLTPKPITTPSVPRSITTYAADLQQDPSGYVSVAMPTVASVVNPTLQSAPQLRAASPAPVHFRPLAAARAVEPETRRMFQPYGIGAQEVPLNGSSSSAILPSLHDVTVYDRPEDVSYTPDFVPSSTARSHRLVSGSVVASSRVPTPTSRQPSVHIQSPSSNGIQIVKGREDNLYRDGSVAAGGAHQRWAVRQAVAPPY